MQKMLLWAFKYVFRRTYLLIFVGSIPRSRITGSWEINIHIYIYISALIDIVSQSGYANLHFHQQIQLICIFINIWKFKFLVFHLFCPGEYGMSLHCGLLWLFNDIISNACNNLTVTHIHTHTHRLYIYREREIDR